MREFNDDAEESFEDLTSEVVLTTKPATTSNNQPSSSPNHFADSG